MKTIEYTVPITRSESIVGYTQAKDSRNAVFAIDTSNSDGNIKIENIKTPMPLRYAKLYTKTPNGVTIKSNSPDILITDIHLNGEPLYYKGLIRSTEENIEILSTGKEKLFRDDKFFYSSKKLNKVIYRLGDAEQERVEEMYPVYIASNRSELSLISSIDNKTYSYYFDGTDYIIECGNPNVSFSVHNKPLVTINRYSTINSDSIKLHTNMFMMSRGRNYFSKDAITNDITPKNEDCYIYNGKIHLSNSGINSETFKLKLYSESGDLIAELSNKDLQTTIMDIYPLMGYIDISKYDKLPNYSYSTIEYTFPVYINNNISIPLYLLRRSKLISVGIKPDGEIVYYCINELGLVHFTNDKSYKEKLSSFAIKTRDGYIDISPLTSYINDTEVEKSDLPININSISDKNNRYGYIEISRIYNKYEIEYIHNTRESIPRTGSVSIRSLHLPNSGYVKFLIGDRKASSINSGVVEITAGISTLGNMRMFKETDSHVFYIMDISNDIYNEDVEEVSDENILRFLNVRMPDFIHKEVSGYKLLGIKNREFSEIDSEVKAVDEENILFKIDKSKLKGFDYISPVYKNSYPTLVHKI